MARFFITDQFLWDLFNLYWKIDDILSLPTYSRWEIGTLPKDRIKRIIAKRKSKYTFQQLINRLAKKGYIKLKSVEPSEGIILTPKGSQKILNIALTKIEKKKRKDGKYLMAIFDIPEKLRKLRDLFREILVILGFRELQKSVWICPYDTLQEVQKLIQQYSLQKYVRLFLITEQEI